MDGPSQRPATVLARVGGLCKQGVRTARVHGAGVSVLTTDGSPQPVLSTDDLSALVEELQFTLGEGPCFDATTTGAPVLISDLTARQEAVAGRWPAFLDEAVSSGVRAVFAFPLGMGAVKVGTLDLYRSTPGPLSTEELGASLVTADSVCAALLSDDGWADSIDDPGLWTMAVHQAAGMVMVQQGGTIEEALLTLRAAAYGEERSVNDLAADVLERRRRFDKEER